jgi:hypothetical protein
MTAALAVFLFALFAAGALVAIGTSRHSWRCNIAGRYWSNNRHWSALTLSDSAAIDPTATLS